MCVSEWFRGEGRMRCRGSGWLQQQGCQHRCNVEL